jgi:gamma-glutamyl:cysteine ligase YbdK (ATP-grasp superfamily)
MPDRKTNPASLRGEHGFGVSPPLSLGARLGRGVAGRVSSEIFTEQIELKTDVCHRADDVLRQLNETRRAIKDAGFGLLGTGAESALDGVERILTEGNGADRQRALHRRLGMDGLLRRLSEGASR